MFAVLQHLPIACLKSLAASLESGILSSGRSQVAVESIAGGDAAELVAFLETCENSGMSPPQTAVVVRGIIETRMAAPDPGQLFDLVLSGPDLPGVPTADTAAVVRSLIGQATKEVLLVGYAVYNGKLLFKPLADQMQRVPGLRVEFCLDIARPWQDTSLGSEIVKRFATNFVAKHWPWSPLPELFYDPRALAPDAHERASLHAKCVVIDKRLALVTSANFTEAAFHRNVEAGLLIRHEPMVRRISQYFEGLLGAGNLKPCPLELSP